MKKLLLSTLFFAALGSAFATVRTVSNSPANPGQYSTYDAAEAASSAGDTIYIQGSSLNYNSIVINKQVVVIGTGHKPQKQAPLVSKFESVGISNSANGAKVIGLECDYLYTSSNTVQNVLISRCKINYYFYFNSNGEHSNFTFESVIFPYGDVNVWTKNYTFNNFFFYNCIFSGHLKDNYYSNNSNLYVQNCVFLGASGNYQWMGNYWKNTVFDNCIFYGRNPRNLGYGDNIYNNCISFQSPDDATFQSGVNNQVSVDPLFVSYPGNALFSYTHNYQLQATSPGHLAGTDSKDIGLYGGTFIYNQYGIPRIPQMLQFNLASSTVPVNGTLQVTIQSAVQQ